MKSVFARFRVSLEKPWFTLSGFNRLSSHFRGRALETFALAIALALAFSFLLSLPLLLTDTLPTLTLYWFLCLTVVKHVVPRTDPHLRTYDRERVG